MSTCSMRLQQRYGFIGLGLMGTPMTIKLLKAGLPVSVWNRDPIKMESLAASGATACTSIEALVSNSDIIMLCISNTEAVESVVFDEGGIVKFARDNQVLIDFSSISPDATREFSLRLKEQSGCQWVDAPVSGGVAGIESGSLVVMAGGDKSVVDSLRTVLSHLSQRVTHMGPVGSGQATKVCNQMLVSCNVLVIAEVLALAEKAGVDSTKIPEALKGGFADSIPLQLTGTRMANRDFDEIKWHVKTLLKDLTMAKDLANSMMSFTPMAHLAKQLMQRCSDDGFAERDPATLIEPYLNH